MDACGTLRAMGTAKDAKYRIGNVLYEKLPSGMSEDSAILVRLVGPSTESKGRIQIWERHDAQEKVPRRTVRV